MNRLVTIVCLGTAVGLIGCAHHDNPSTTNSGHDMSNMSTPANNNSAPTSGDTSSTTGGNASSSANTSHLVDLHNTICPVSGDAVESSPLTETYNGKIYHLCCDDCIKPFKKDPQKFEAAVAANPAKYGVKTDTLQAK